MIDSITEQKIKDAAKVVDVIGQFYTLTKKGKNYQCLCPFHDDHSLGSFSIDTEKNIYHCFACDAGGDAIEFLKKHENLSYEDALRWLAKFYCIFIDDNKEIKYRPRTMAPPAPAPEQLPMLEINIEKYVKPPTRRPDNALNRWLKSLPWSEEQRKRLDIILKDYIVGSSKDDRPIFWQIDEKGICRTGKMIYYKDDGHRLKGEDGKSLHPSWIHNYLMPEDRFDNKKQRFEKCLFGLHLLDFVKPKTVNIVESEKSVIIAATMWGNLQKNLWMAIPSGKETLKREVLQPLIDHKVSITLYPDMDSIDDWKAKAKAIGYKKLTVADRWMRENWREEDGEKADVADILVRILKGNVFNSNPKLKYLKEVFDVELISVKKI